MENINWIIDFILCVAVCVCGFYCFKLYKNIEFFNKNKRDFGKMIHAFSSSVEKSASCLSAINEIKDLGDLKLLIDEAHKAANALTVANSQAQELMRELGDMKKYTEFVTQESRDEREIAQAKEQDKKISLTQKNYYDLLPKIEKKPSDK